MQIHWDDTQPIYIQLRDRVLNMILDGSLGEGEALPSVRNISAEYQLNPITVSKAYQLLVESELAEKRRGLGMFVTEGAQQRLLAEERNHFLQVEWPALLKRIERLQIPVADLMRALEKEHAQEELVNEESAQEKGLQIDSSQSDERFQKPAAEKELKEENNINNEKEAGDE